MEVLHNIFNPFFSTKDYGTGLGLAIAQRIVSRHYGQIEVNNEMGKGVTFIVTLPVARAPRPPTGLVRGPAEVA